MGKILSDLADYYSEKSCIVTGGASFIGSHLVEALHDCGAQVTVIDDFSSGRLAHLSNVLDSPRVKVIEADLRDGFPQDVPARGVDVLFHLAAIHGGRGFIDTFASAMFDNLLIDRTVMSWSAQAAEMFVHASSACAYPISLQARETDRSLLAEESAGFDEAHQSFPDGTYGWVKLMGELQAKTIAESGGFRARSARVFTAYGERENESHAAIALIAKALLKLDPFPIWGSGQQTRNFTYVGDTVTGLMLLGSDQRDLEYDVFNVGTSQHSTVLEFVDVVFDLLEWRPANFDLQLDKPVGVGSRAASNTKLQSAFGWEPNTLIRDGVSATLTWYKHLVGRPETPKELEALLIAR